MALLSRRAHPEETVLLVEDEPVVREVVERMLEQGGYNVLAAASPAEAIEIVQSGARIDVLLTDVLLPEMSGHVLARKIHALRPNLPLVYTSGYVNDDVDERGAAQRAPRHLEKPFSAEELAAAIGGALGHAGNDDSPRRCVSPGYTRPA